MNFTDSPYEPFMKQPSYYQPPGPIQSPKGSPCAGCPYWRGVPCVSCYRDLLREKAGQSADSGR